MTWSPRRVGFIRKLGFASVIGLAIGFCLGYLGAWVEHRNESRFGTSYSQFKFEWVSFFSLPGEIVVGKFIHTYDWTVDEAWNYRMETSLWNALFWCVAVQIAAGIHSAVTVDRPMPNGDARPG